MKTFDEIQEIVFKNGSIDVSDVVGFKAVLEMKAIFQKLNSGEISKAEATRQKLALKGTYEQLAVMNVTHLELFNHVAVCAMNISCDRVESAFGEFAVAITALFGERKIKPYEQKLIDAIYDWLNELSKEGGT